MTNNITSILAQKAEIEVMLTIVIILSIASLFVSLTSASILGKVAFKHWWRERKTRKPPKKKRK